MVDPVYGIVQMGGLRAQFFSRCIQWLQRPRVSILEVGSYEGQSALAWSAAIAEHCPEGGSVICIDPWSEDYLTSLASSGGAYQEMYTTLQSGTAYARFLGNIKLASPAAPIYHGKGTLHQALGKLEGRTFDIVYLDGNHFEAEVAKDIVLAKYLVSPGGLLTGDDLELQFDACDTVRALDTCNSVDYIGYHPGVTVAVWNAFGRVFSVDAAWAVQKSLTGAWVFPEGLS